MKGTLDRYVLSSPLPRLWIIIGIDSRNGFDRKFRSRNKLKVMALLKIVKKNTSSLNIVKIKTKTEA